MKKILLFSFLSLLLLGSANSLKAQVVPEPLIDPLIVNVWRQEKNADTAFHSAASFVIGTKLYVVLGDTAEWYFRPHIPSRTWAYDTVSKTWLRKADFPGKPRMGAVGFSIGTKGYIGGGRKMENEWDTIYKLRRIASPNDTQMVHYAAYNTWTPAQKAAFTMIGTPILSRTDTVYYVKNNTTNFFTYYNKNFFDLLPSGTKANYSVFDKLFPDHFEYRGDSVLKDFWEYDTTTNKWTQKADIPGTKHGRAYPVGFAMGGKGYIGLGYDIDTIKVSYKKTFSTNKWINQIVFDTLSAGPPPVIKTDTTWLYDTIWTTTYTVKDSVCTLKDMYQYDPAGNTWAKKTDFPGQRRANAIAFTIDDTAAMVGLGRDTAFDKNILFSDFYSYTPSTDKWYKKADFVASPRYSPVAFNYGFLGYVITGYDGFPRKDFFEYNGRSDTWERLPDFKDSVRVFAVAGTIGRLGVAGSGFGFTGKGNRKDFYSWLIDSTRVYITNPIDSTCTNQSITMNWRVPGTTLPAGNRFVVQLSDSAGNFFVTTNIDSVLSTSATGSITFKIPTTLDIPSSEHYRLRIISTSPKLRGTPTKKFLLKQAPIISKEPDKTTDTTCIGAITSMFAEGKGYKVKYQWIKNGLALAGSSRISGVNEQKLVLDTIQSGDAGDYALVVTGDCNTPDTSAKIKLLVLSIPPPVIVNQPDSLTICETDPAFFSVTATGSKLNYMWIKDHKDTIKDNATIVGSKTANLQFTSTKLKDSGYYRAYVIEDCGARTATDSVKLSFNPLTKIVTQPVNVDTVEFVDVTFTVVATGANLKYQWKKGTLSINDGVKYSGTKTNTLTIKNATLLDVGFYICEVTGDCGPKLTSYLGLLEIQPFPVIITQPDTAKDCAGATVYFDVVADGANLNYQWFKGSTATPLVNTPGKYSGVDERVLVVYDIQAGDAGDYLCEVSSSPKAKVLSNAGKLIVKPIPNKPQVLDGFKPKLLCDISGADAYRWYLNNVFQPQFTTQAIQPVEIGDYCVRVIVDGCQSPISDCVFWFSTGMNELSGGNIKIYPNPASNQVTLDIPTDNAEIKVYDLVGHEVLTQNTEKQGKVDIDLSTLSKGMYIVTCNCGGQTYAGKLIKE